MIANLIQGLLLILILLQIALMIYLFYINHKREKADKKFYEELCESLKNQPAVFLDEGVQCEQSEENASEK